MLRNKIEGLSISFLGGFFLTPPLLVPHFYDVFEGLSSSSILSYPRYKEAALLKTQMLKTKRVSLVLRRRGIKNTIICKLVSLPLRNPFRLIFSKICYWLYQQQNEKKLTQVEVISIDNIYTALHQRAISRKFYQNSSKNIFAVLYVH